MGLDVPGVGMATGMTGLPLESPLSSYQTEIANNATTSGPAIPSVNYYQRVMSGFFETMGIPILQGRSFQSTDAVSAGRVAVVNETLTNTEGVRARVGHVHRSNDNTSARTRYRRSIALLCRRRDALADFTPAATSIR